MIVAFDLDGTLLNENQRVPTSTIETIKRLQQRGIHIAVATGRSYSASKFYAKMINADYVVACNGALVVDEKDGHLLHQKPIQKDTANSILSLLYDHHDKLKIQWDSFDTYYTNNVLAFEQDYVDAYNSHYPEDVFSLEVVDSLEAYRDLSLHKDLAQEIYQIFTFSMVKPPDEYHMILEKLNLFDDIQYVDFKTNYTDVTRKNVSKGRALEMLAGRHGYNREEVMAFGDHYNDESMLNYAGVSVAMGNADESIKALAKHVARPNFEGGVEMFLKEFFSLQ